MIKRRLHNQLFEFLEDRKVVILLGPRQVGKTTMVKNLIDSYQSKAKYMNCDQIYVRTELAKQDLSHLSALLGDAQLVVIDEAQRVRDIGIVLKLIHDELPHIRLLVTGSSSLDLMSTISEPLTGRKWEFRLYPISWAEFSEHVGALNARMQLEQCLVFGMYPDILLAQKAKARLLDELTSSYLYKDVLAVGDLRRPDLLDRLVQLLAYQVGSEVSYNELSNKLQVDRSTVMSYLELLEKAFVVFRMGAFKRNLRKEVGRSQKIYFYDNGIRNAVIGNYNSIDNRNDVGALWENFLMAERLKLNSYQSRLNRSYFWRTTERQEIDLIEEENGQLEAFEFKWGKIGRKRLSATFTNAYAGVKAHFINQENFEQFLMEPTQV